MAEQARTAPRHVERVADTRLPTDHATFRMTAYRDDRGMDHVVLSLGVTDDDGPDLPPPLVRVHSECLTGDALGSRRCDCGEQLQHALQLVARTGRGAVVYARGHEGRAIGLAEKLRAYALQDRGVDTVDANLALGHPADARTYDHCAAMLLDLGMRRVRLLSSNPAKELALGALGIEVVERVPLVVPDREENAFYLATKRARMGHDEADQDEWDQLLAGRIPVAGELAQRYGDLNRADGPRVLAQLGQSLDGFIASRTGDAAFVTGELDREHLHRLRALVDAVVVGGATVACDDPQLTVRAVDGPHPTRVVLDPRGATPADAVVLTDAASPTLWVVGADARVRPVGDHVEVVRWPGAGPMEPRAVLDLLAARGLHRVLVEGGGRLVSAFVRAEAVDRLYLTTAPVLIGDGVPGLRVDGQDRLTDALRPTARRYRLGDDVVTELDLRPLTARAPTLADDVQDAS
ncbi:GTP cyclohydrolase II [Serinicoccus sp. CNJ-927]|uniref:GTP cyclohydrolase II n=1 Tax=Serinicoccus sp. CNJ-927 TaxID=1904970 RepID=UPI0009658E59|nr:GTP cyclohydrolase II [Serinicoccus sp. CNJ-927]OLT39353.1 GTP cyclohydrolase II [Serinicoccus sp. CNJ-927]